MDIPQELLNQDRRDFLKKTLNLAKTGIASIVLSNAVGCEFVSELFEKPPKIELLKMQRKRIAKMIDLTDKNQKLSKKEIINIESYSPFANAGCFAISSGNPKKRYFERRSSNFAESLEDYFLGKKESRIEKIKKILKKATPVDQCPLFVIFPKGAIPTQIEQSAFIENLYIKGWTGLTKKGKNVFSSAIEDFITYNTNLEKLTKNSGPLVPEAYPFLFNPKNKKQKKRAKALTKKIIEEIGQEGYYWARINFFKNSETAEKAIIETKRRFNIGFDASEINSDKEKIYFIADQPKIGGILWKPNGLEKTVFSEQEIQKDKPIDYYDLKFSESIRNSQKIRIETEEHGIDWISRFKKNRPEIYNGVRYDLLVYPSNSLKDRKVNWFKISLKSGSKKSLEIIQDTMEFKSPLITHMIKPWAGSILKYNGALIGVYFTDTRFHTRFIIANEEESLSERVLLKEYYQELIRYLENKKTRIPGYTKNESLRELKYIYIKT